MVCSVLHVLPNVVIFPLLLDAQKFKEEFVQCQDLLSTPDGTSAPDNTSALADKMANLEVDSKDKQSGDKAQKQGDGCTESNKQTEEVTETKTDEKTTTDADVAHE